MFFACIQAKYLQYGIGKTAILSYRLGLFFTHQNPSTAMITMG